MAQMDVLDIINNKLGPDVYDSERMQAAVDEAEFAIRNYCGLWGPGAGVSVYESLPLGLQYVWADIAIGILRMPQAANLNAADGNNSITVATGGAIKSLKEGDITVDFFEGSSGTVTTGAVYNTLADLIASKTDTLNHYRRIYGSWL